MPRNVHGRVEEVVQHDEALTARMRYAMEAGHRAAIKLSGRAMPPATMARPGPNRNRFWVVLHDGTQPLPVATAAGIQRVRVFHTWHECASVVSDAIGVRPNAVFHAFASWVEIHAYVDAAGRGWEE